MIQLGANQISIQQLQVDVRLVELFLVISFILTNIHLYILANIFLRVGMPCSCESTFHGMQGGVKVLAGLSPSSQIAGF
jgi:hypothetical protein